MYSMLSWLRLNGAISTGHTEFRLVRPVGPDKTARTLTSEGRQQSQLVLGFSSLNQRIAPCLPSLDD